MSKKSSHDLLQAAVQAARNSYAPYSEFKVGAAARTKDGSVFIGANMENASYGVTMCAEVGALQAASTAGKLADITEIAVAGGRTEGARPIPGRVVTPCGRCRQLILESAHLGGRDIAVLCADLALTSIEHHTCSELLPHGFGPETLGIADNFRESYAKPRDK
jgi:cytidine deaminase